MAVQVENDLQSHLPNAGLSRQIIATAIVSIVTLTAGMNLGWPSPMGLLLKSKDSPVGVMNDSEISLVAALPTYSGFILLSVFGLMGRTLGRKWTVLIGGSVYAVSSVMSTFATTKLTLYIARALSVCALMGATTGIIYTSEVCHDSIRGRMLSNFAITLNVGILVSYTCGGHLNYLTYNIILTVIPSIAVLLLFWMPETPPFLVTKNRMESAEESLVWLRGGNRELAQLELQTIQPPKPNQNLSIFQTFKTRASKRILVICLFALTLQTLSGEHAILNYCAMIFEEAGSPMSPNNSAILIAALNAGAAIVSLLLVDKLGRKPLMYISCVGGTVCMLALTLYLYLRMKGVDVSSLGWIPIASVGIFSVTYGLGLSNIPTILNNELCPADIKPVLIAVITTVSVMLITAVVQSFPFIKDNIGLYFAFLPPTLFNFLGILFTRFMMFETKGKTLQEITDMLDK